MVCIVGSFNVDHVWRCETLPMAGQTLHGEYSTGPGGKGFNQAIASARCGVSSHFICALGDDAGAAWARELAAQSHLQLIAKQSVHPTGTAGIWVDASAHNAILISAGANADLDPTFVLQHAAELQGARVVLAQLETPLPSVTQALRLAHGAGALTVLNPAPAPLSHLPSALLEACTVITPNETELARLVPDLDPTADIKALPDAELHALCRRALPQGTVVVTLGDHGCFVSHPQAQLHGDRATHYRAAAYPAQAIDTTGAGDAFNGALCASLAQRSELPFAEHVQWACAYAAFSTEQPGAALSMPDAAAVSQRYGIAFT